MLRLTVLVSLLFLTTIEPHAQTPASMNYQGRLVDGTNLVTGSHTIDFMLYTNSAGSGQIFYAESDTVLVNDGFYSTELGDNPLPPGSLGNGDPLTDNFSGILIEGADKLGQFWLEVRIDGTPLSPREKILSTTYATASQVAMEALDVVDGSIQSWDLAYGAVTSEKIANGTITRFDLADGMRSTLDSADGSLTDAVVVDDDGNVGIGTETPFAGVQIDTGVALSGSLVRSVLQDGGTFNDLSGASCSVVQGDLVYVAGSSDNALSIINISDPGNPFQLAVLRDGVNGFDHLSGVSWLAVDGNYLYAASPEENAVSIINISIPVLANLTTALVDETGGYSNLDGAGRIAIHNDLLFIPAVNDDAVTIVDISTPSAPVLKSVLKDGVNGFNELDGANAVACESNFLYIASSIDDSMTIADISDPANPVFVAAIKDGTNTFQQLDEAYDVAVSGGYVYVAARSDNSLTVVDCRTPSTPQLLNAITVGSNGFTYLNGIANVEIDGSRLYIAARNSHAVTVADISDPAAPRPIAEMLNGTGGYYSLLAACQVFPVGDRLYLTAKSPGSVTIADLLPESAAAEVGLYVADRVGIGTPLPTEALDVRGNIIASGQIITSGDITADNMVAGGFVSAAGGLETDGDLDVTGTAYLSGTAYLYSDLNMLGGNIFASGQIITSGDIAADNMVAGGFVSAASGLETDGDLDVTGTAYLWSGLNIPGGNINASGQIITSGDIVAGGFVSTTSGLETDGNLHVAGDILAGNDLRASNDVYLVSFSGGGEGRNVRMNSSGRLYPSSSKTNYVFISPVSFNPSEDDHTRVIHRWPSAWMDGGGYTEMMAPVQLPDGAHVSSVQFKYYDVANTNFDGYDITISMNLVRNADSGLGLEDLMAYYYPTGWYSGSNETEITDISYPDIDNENYSYHLKVRPINWGWHAGLQFNGAKIQYVIDD